MAKVRDLGIKVIPETMRPPEMGGGAAPADCTNACTNAVTCIGCTLVTCGFVTPLPPCPCSMCSEPVTLTCRTTDGILATQQPEDLSILKTHLREQLAVLEQAEVALREAELNAELERLKLHRSRLNAKK